NGARGCARNVPTFINSAERTSAVHSWQTNQKTATKKPMNKTETGAYRAETSPFSKALMATEPVATPMEKITRNRLATSLLANSTFLARGGNWMNSTAP